MTTPYDDMPIEALRENFGWFGPPWWSWICYGEDGGLNEEIRKPFPAGESCLHCEEPFDEAAGDSGQAMPCYTTAGFSIRHVHKECQLRTGIGSIAHLEKRCHCHGGQGNETPGMTRRQDALAVWEWVRAHGVRGL